MRRRYPRSVFGHGTEPDPRFSLANERTFLAWIRTSLALVAVGVALEALELQIQPTLRTAVAVIFVVLGFLAALHAWVAWVRTERSLRLSRALPGPSTGPVVAVGICLAIVLLSTGLLLR